MQNLVLTAHTMLVCSLLHMPQTIAFAELHHTAAFSTPLFQIFEKTKKIHRARLSNTQLMLLHGVQVCTTYPRPSLADQMLPGSTECCLLWLVQSKPSNSCRYTLSGWGGALWYALICLHVSIFAAHSRICSPKQHKTFKFGMSIAELILTAL